MIQQRKKRKTSASQTHGYDQRAADYYQTPPKEPKIPFPVMLLRKESLVVALEKQASYPTQALLKPQKRNSNQYILISSFPRTHEMRLRKAKVHSRNVL